MIVVVILAHDHYTIVVVRIQTNYFLNDLNLVIRNDDFILRVLNSTRVGWDAYYLVVVGGLPVCFDKTEFLRTWSSTLLLVARIVPCCILARRFFAPSRTADLLTEVSEHVGS